MSEARKWLTENKNKSPFATNYFCDLEEHGPGALELVKKLYAAGAKKVEIAGIYDEPWRLAEEGGPYADTLHIHTKGCALSQVLEICTIGKSYDPDEMSNPDKSSGIITMWWD